MARQSKLTTNKEPEKNINTLGKSYILSIDDRDLTLQVRKELVRFSNKAAEKTDEEYCYAKFTRVSDRKTTE